MYSTLVLESIHVPGDVAATADNLIESRALFGSSLATWILLATADIAITATWYLLLRPAGQLLSLLTAVFRIAFAAVLAGLLGRLYDAYLLTDAEQVAGLEQQQARTMAWAALDSFSNGFLPALIFFGMHVVLLGVLLHRSRYVPRLVSLLVLVAGAAYIVDGLVSVFAPDQGGLLSAVLAVPTFIGEPVLLIWLLVKGVRTPRPEP